MGPNDLAAGGALAMGIPREIVDLNPSIYDEPDQEPRALPAEEARGQDNNELANSTARKPES